MTAEPTAGFFDGLEHVLPVRIYYEDTDFTGMVYHANYLRYFERGRSDYMRLAGVDHTSLLNRPDPAAFTLTRIEVDYKRPARVDDALLVRTAWEAMKGPRSFIRQRIVRGEELIAQAMVHAVVITPEGRPRRPPPELVERLAARLTGPAAP
ncbi:MAG TPA: YbgC/FadM family acyl-CoA thioesterase [Caulobacteraceae bacterium]|jgi:acyl-CoA thioester hydrolase|nr:YbgC/FadM family acyl-CoA thioesterase [Caulobacteraceae bacterium]